MRITLNGKDEFVKEKIELLSFLRDKNIGKNGVVVILNEKVLKKDEFEKIILKENDEIEILRFVAGG